MTLAEFFRLQRSPQAIVLPAGSAAAAGQRVRLAALSRMSLRHDLVFKSPKAAGAMIALRKTAKK